MFGPKRRLFLLFSGHVRPSLEQFLDHLGYACLLLDHLDLGVFDVTHPNCMTSTLNFARCTLTKGGAK